MGLADLDLIAGIKEASEGQLDPIMRAVLERYPHDHVSGTIASSNTNKVTNPFARGSIRAWDLPEAEEPERIWFGMYPGKVVLFIGETGAGKSSLLYNICVHAARNEPLWNVPFGLHRPIKILYIDPENSGNFAEGQGGLCSQKLERIGQGKPKDLIFHDGHGVNLADSSHIAALGEYIKFESIDVVVLDPIANLFRTKDENDNAEAAKQMTSLTALSRSTGACVIAVHHTGKNTNGDYGRGASARLGAADVALMLKAKSGNENVDDTFDGELQQRTDVCRLQIVKNRLEGRGSIYLQMEGEDRFKRSTYAEWQGGCATGSSVTKSDTAEVEILKLLDDGDWRARSDIQGSMKALNIGEHSTAEALKKLQSRKLIDVDRRAKGLLRYKMASDQGCEQGNDCGAVSRSPKETAKLRSVTEDVEWWTEDNWHDDERE